MEANKFLDKLQVRLPMHLLNLVEKSFFRPILKVQLMRGMDVSNYSLDQLIISVKRCELLKMEFDFDIEKRAKNYELDTLPLSVLKFTRVPEKDPMLNFAANYGKAFSVKGPPVNKPKDPFGFNF